MTPNGKRWTRTVALELLPAAVLNFAVSFALGSVLRSAEVQHSAQISVAAGCLVFLLAWRLLRMAGGSSDSFSLPAFEAPLPEIEEVGEHGSEEDLPSATVIQGQFASAAVEQQFADDELLLDDILEELSPDARVVRLFDPAAMPTAGELRDRIDDHLRSARPRLKQPDATEELNEAIRALRQSLR